MRDSLRNRPEKKKQECEPEKERVCEKDRPRERDPGLLIVEAGSQSQSGDLILSNELFSLARVAGARCTFGDMKVTRRVSSATFPPREGAPTHSEISPEAFSSEGPAFFLSYYMFTKRCQS